MFFYGGMLGVIIVIVIFVWICKKLLFEVGDFVVFLVLFGLFVGCIGNFINGELWG